MPHQQIHMVTDLPVNDPPVANLPVIDLPEMVTGMDLGRQGRSFPLLRLLQRSSL